MRLAILTAGTLLVGLVVRFVAGVAIGGQQTASAPAETVTVERTVEAQEEQASATGSASASASVAPEQADKDCQVGQEAPAGR